MNMSNQGDCIHGREFCIECHDKKTLRRPGSVWQAHRIIVQLQAENEALRQRVDELEAEAKLSDITENSDQSHLLARYLGDNKALRNPWISVDDRLPEPNDTIVGMNDAGSTWFDCFDEDEPLGRMIYWLRLPPLPSEPPA